MRSNSLNPGFLLFSLDIPSISCAWVDEKKFCSGFPFSPFCRKYVQILGRIFGIYQISQAGAAHRTKAGQKIAGRSRLQSPRHVKNQLPCNTAVPPVLPPARPTAALPTVPRPPARRSMRSHRPMGGFPQRQAAPRHRAPRPDTMHAAHRAPAIRCVHRESRFVSGRKQPVPHPARAQIPRYRMCYLL